MIVNMIMFNVCNSSTYIFGVQFEMTIYTKHAMGPFIFYISLHSHFIQQILNINIMLTQFLRLHIHYIYKIHIFIA